MSETSKVDSNAAPKVLVTLHGRNIEPTVEELMSEFGLTADELDTEYGVQMIDPAAGDYVVLVDQVAAQRIASEYAEVSGPYSDPKIETFGPPE